MPRVGKGAVKDYLSRLNTNNSMRPDGMPLRMLWELADALVTHCTIFRLSWCFRERLLMT